MIERSQIQQLRTRISQPRKFIQVLVGPRQVGKTTMVSQLIQEINMPFLFESADGVFENDFSWLTRLWDTARLNLKLSQSDNLLLIIDEVQKISNWSEIVKKEWDSDSRNGIQIKLLLLGSSRLLIKQGLTESLAGRFEKIYLGHWNYAEMNAAFQWDLNTYIFYGGYPGAADLIDDESRWKSYVKDSLIETSISKDILMLTRVVKPALLKKTFEIGSAYSGQILSFTKMLGELQDAGNTTTLSHYVQLLSDSGLLGGIEKYAGEEIRRKSSILKFQVFNNALLSAQSRLAFKNALEDASVWGRYVESAVGAHLLNYSVTEDYRLYYWREGGAEVDFIIEYYGDVIAFEVKSGYKSNVKGLNLFMQKFKPSKSYIIGTNGISLDVFLRTNPVEFF